MSQSGQTDPSGMYAARSPSVNEPFPTTQRKPPIAASSSRSAFGCGSMRRAWILDSKVAMMVLREKWNQPL